MNHWWPEKLRGVKAPVVAVVLTVLIVVAFQAFSHVRRVRLITDSRDPDTFGSRHRRHIEVPFGASQAFDMLEAALRELPYVEFVEAVRDSLQLRARVRRIDPYLSSKKGPIHLSGAGS